MATESKLQSDVSKWLKKQGCFVMVIQPQAGIPTGTADIFFCKEGFYGWLELKTSKTSKVQPLQKPFIDKMDEWSWAKFCWPDRWPELKSQLEQIL